MAQARRYFHEALQNDKARGEKMDNEKRLALRKEKPISVLNEINPDYALEK